MSTNTQLRREALKLTDQERREKFCNKQTIEAIDAISSTAESVYKVRQAMVKDALADSNYGSATRLAVELALKAQGWNAGNKLKDTRALHIGRIIAELYSDLSAELRENDDFIVYDDYGVEYSQKALDTLEYQYQEYLADIGAMIEAEQADDGFVASDAAKLYSLDSFIRNC